MRGVTLAAASTVDKSLKGKLSKTTDMAAASEVGKLVAERAKAQAWRRSRSTAAPTSSTAGSRLWPKARAKVA